MSAGPPDVPLPRDVQRILVVCPTWVGDTVMATALLQALRRARPEARIIAAVRPGQDELLEGAEYVDAIITADLKSVWRAAGTLRAARADVVLLLPNSFRSALVARLAGIPRRLGYARDGRGWLLTHACPVQRSSAPTPQLAYYAALGAWALGTEVPTNRLALAVTDAQAAAAEDALRDIPGTFIVLCPGANRIDKRWPPERFAAVSAWLAAQHGWSVVVSGAPAEADVVQPVVDGASGCGAHTVNLVERGISLGTLKGILARAHLVITNDTGPRHIAAALGTPAVVLFGPTDHRWTTLEGVREVHLLAEPFLPEELVADDYAKICAMDRITVRDVMASVPKLATDSV